MTPVDEYHRWLTDFLPPDYDTDPQRYRFDRELRRRHQRASFEAGWMMPQWPLGEGGRGLSPLDAVAVRIASARRAAPRLVNVQSVGVVAPALRRFGTPEQRERLLTPTLRGDIDWALGMSEPGAGSDLAGLTTRARRDGDRYIVTGQKIWSTQAHDSQWYLLFCRTGSGGGKHAGITCLLVDLSLPGTTVRQIPMGWDDADTFCEVFLDEVEVPVSCVLGAEGEGWRVAMASLNHERDMIWVMNSVEIERGLRRIARDLAAGDGDDMLVELGRLATDSAALQATGRRAMAHELAGRAAPEFHILKLLGSESLQRTWQLAADAAGPAGSADLELHYEEFESLGATLYGGTSEVQRNIIGERVLGLPRD
ncbi:acyl-CoA dehydrogenase family protein [Nocardia sp. alder85J]|uniref:acyl-CoA dehydrogenase family protein n=1 Tax=Nocardia sp. alder85J TaxID=2862949 RepID=UPI001CD2E743|nr:acyl-CoA dehydrogenase family protein [Nocardia sp. alder85J]MCX4096829.1 acyl-CoA dehydrogenase family protein [Nocardia sp. alder85J]